MAVRILDSVDDLMFSSGELRLALEAQAGKMRAAIEAEPEESLKQADADECGRPGPSLRRRLS